MSPQSTIFKPDKKGLISRGTLYPPYNVKRRDPARMPAGPKRAPGRYEVPVSLISHEWCTPGLCIAKTHKWCADECDVERGVSIFAEALYPRQLCERGDARKDGICSNYIITRFWSIWSGAKGTYLGCRLGNMLPETDI